MVCHTRCPLLASGMLYPMSGSDMKPRRCKELKQRMMLQLWHVQFCHFAWSYVTSSTELLYGPARSWMRPAMLLTRRYACGYSSTYVRFVMPGPGTHIAYRIMMRL